MTGRWIVFFTTLLLLCSCAGTPPQFNYYTLRATSQINTHPLPQSLGIAPVDIPGWLDQTSLVWSDGDVRLKANDNDRWAEPLAVAVTRVMMQDFSRYYGDDRISMGPWTRAERPERVVDMQILSLGRRQNQLLADVKWELSDKDRKIMITRYHSYSQPLSDLGSPAEFVQAFSDVINQIAQDVSVSLQ